MEIVHEENYAEGYLHPYLDTLRQVSDANMDLAVPAALFYCAEHNVPAPAWLTLCASRLLNGLLHLHDDRTRKSMRKNIITYKRNQLHFARYDAVNAAKDARDGLQNDVKALKRLDGLKAKIRVKEVTSMHNRIGKSDEQVFEAVSSQLKGTTAAAGADTIKKSYQEISRQTRLGKMRFRYHVFNDSFLQRIGASQKL